MDKYEYKVRSEEILALVEEQNYKEAAEIADTIDWRRVQSVKMLCTISDVYKMVRRYQDSKAILLLAEEKRPGSRMIIFALAELCLKLGDVVNAWEYYKQFCQVAPDDPRRYILLYKVYVAHETSLDEQIKVLEKLKEEEYTDRWAYELAYLYHRIGFASKCVEECDEMILWFGEGKFVRKAMELKMLHEPLTPKQQAMYSGEKEKEVESGDTQVIPDLGAAMTKEVGGIDPSTAPTIQFDPQDVAEIQVKTMDDSPYNTINLQKALAESMAQIMGDETVPVWQNAQDGPVDDEMPQTPVAEEPTTQEPADEADDITAVMPSLLGDAEEELGETRQIPPVPDAEEIFFEDPNTVDLGAVAQAVEETPKAASEEEKKAKEEDSEEQKRLKELEAQIRAELDLEEEPDEDSEDDQEDNLGDSGTESDEKPQGPTYEMESRESGVKKVIVPTNPDSIFHVPDAAPAPMQPTEFATQKSGFDTVLAQEPDGQISLVMPDAVLVEKQITGQLSIQDILLEWENWRKEKEKRLQDDVRRHVMEQTGELFSEFEEAAKEGLLEHLQQAAIEAEKREKEEEERRLAEEEARRIEREQEEKDSKVDTDLPDEAEDDDVTSEPAEETEHQLTQEEKDLFGEFLKSRKAKTQIVEVLDLISLASYTGNAIVTGPAEAGALELAKNLVKYMQISDANFSGRAAKISGKAMNKKNPEAVLSQLKNGALIIEDAGDMNCSCVEALIKQLQVENRGVLVIIVDTKAAVESLLKVNDVLREPFNARFDIEALSTGALVNYGQKFAYEREFSIDEMGLLALHTRIEDMQTLDYAVTISDVKGIVKEAIRHGSRRTPSHFFQILAGRRYDEEDMIILREDDFLMY